MQGEWLDIRDWDYTDYKVWRDRREIQREYNRVLSGVIETIALAPRAPYIRLIPWWRLDIRLASWAGKWDSRFRMRYHDRRRTCA